MITHPKGQRFTLKGIEWPPLSEDWKDRLEKPFREEDIHQAIEGRSNLKSPGPHGMTNEFFFLNWNILKADLVKVFQDFFENGIINNKTNETYICLIPKKTNTNKVENFRPINLVMSL